MGAILTSQSRRNGFPENARIVLSEEGLGGENLAYMLAARGGMLEYALELEQKIAECGVAEENSVFMMAFCGNGVEWHDSLREFLLQGSPPR
jgi:hypothetical protein